MSEEMVRKLDALSVGTSPWLENARKKRNKMKNRDNYKEEFVHLYIALRRRKNNPDGQELCFREIITDTDTSLKILEQRLAGQPGVWNIHKTVNKRCVATAVKAIQIGLINNPDKCFSLISDYKTELMKPEARAERNLLLDVDDKSVIELIYEIIPLSFYQVSETPNGFHIVTELFDTRYIEEHYKDVVTIQRDGYVFVKQIEIKD